MQSIRVFGNCLIYFCLISLYGCFGGSDSSSEPETVTENGDLNKTFERGDSLAEKSIGQITGDAKEAFAREGWEEKILSNGQLPDCFNFIPAMGIVDNSLEVYVGRNTDVVIKVMHLATNKCIRFVFINSGTSYQIKNIPEGKFYVKIAYGKKWTSKIENGHCIGKFINNSMYQKGEDILDFAISQTSDGYRIPSFKLELDVISSNISNSFKSQNISEGEFNQ